MKNDTIDNLIRIAAKSTGNPMIDGVLVGYEMCQSYVLNDKNFTNGMISKQELKQIMDAKQEFIKKCWKTYMDESKKEAYWKTKESGEYRIDS